MEVNQSSSQPEPEPVKLRVHILIFSYAFDIDYLEYCLKSIAKFASGFSGVTVVVPEKELAMFQSRFPETDFRGVEYPADEKLGHIFHQSQKCSADKWVPVGTDLILFTDSDCIWVEPFSPDDYIVDGKPVLLCERYDSLKPGSNPWQEPTENILRRSVSHEHMRRHPHVSWTAMFPELRKHVESIQGQEFVSFVLTLKPTFPWQISEFNLMGAFIYDHPEWKEKYHFIDLTGGNPHPESSKKLVQFWSRAKIDQPQSTPWDLKLVPLEFCKKVGL